MNTFNVLTWLVMWPDVYDDEDEDEDGDFFYDEDDE